LVEREALRRSAQREIAVLSRFRHPHIVRLLGYTVPSAAGSEQPCLVYELAEKGALDQALKDDTLAGELTWQIRVRIALGLAKAINYLHRGGAGSTCFHRDVKAANVCLTANLSPKLIDCGLAMLQPESGATHAGHTMLTATGGVLGTYGYMCPRYVSSGKFGAKSEVYSFGVVLLELITGRLQNKPDDLYTTYIEDEERNLANDADPRAGVWPEAVISELVVLATRCLGLFRFRLTSLAPAMQQLAILAREHCRATVEEVQLGAMREEVERLKLQAHVEDTQRERRAAASAAARVTCMVCFDEYDPGHGLSCEKGHFLCGHMNGDDCLGGHVHARVEQLEQTDRLTAQAEAAEVAGDSRRQRELCGAVHCPVPGCEAPAFTDVQIVRHASEDMVGEYLGAKILLPVAREASRIFETAQTAVRAAQAEAAGRVSAGMAREAAHRLLEQQMQKELPTARQCGQCGVGPVIHEGCWDYAAHQGEQHGTARINNACPRCGWFSRDANLWPKWNGKMPRDEADEVKAAETLDSGFQGTAQEQRATELVETTRRRRLEVDEQEAALRRRRVADEQEAVLQRRRAAEQEAARQRQREDDRFRNCRNCRLQFQMGNNNSSACRGNVQHPGTLKGINGGNLPGMPYEIWKRKRSNGERPPADYHLNWTCCRGGWDTRECNVQVSSHVE
jgi:interleukin-1 receptor-associated kinase 4